MQVCSEEEGQAVLKKLEAELAASDLDAEKLAERMSPKVRLSPLDLGWRRGICCRSSNSCACKITVCLLHRCSDSGWPSSRRPSLPRRLRRAA